MFLWISLDIFDIILCVNFGLSVVRVIWQTCICLFLTLECSNRSNKMHLYLNRTGFKVLSQETKGSQHLKKVKA